MARKFKKSSYTYVINSKFLKSKHWRKLGLIMQNKLHYFTGENN